MHGGLRLSMVDACPAEGEFFPWIGGEHPVQDPRVSRARVTVQRVYISARSQKVKEHTEEPEELSCCFGFLFSQTKPSSTWTRSIQDLSQAPERAPALGRPGGDRDLPSYELYKSFANRPNQTPPPRCTVFCGKPPPEQTGR